MVAFFFPPTPSFGGPNITQTDIRGAADVINIGTQTFNDCSLGAVAAAGETRLIAVLVNHGDRGSSPGSGVTCTVGGTSMTEYVFSSTGDGSGKATGNVIFIGSPSGTTGDIVVQWTNLIEISIIVLRLIGYTTTGNVTREDSATGSDGIQNYNVSNGDAIICVASSGGNNTPMTLTGVTQRGEGNAPTGGGANNRKVWGWDARMAANSSLNLQVTPWSVSLGDNSMASIKLSKI